LSIVKEEKEGRKRKRRDSRPSGIVDRPVNVPITWNRDDADTEHVTLRRVKKRWTEGE
jgi:hypothetical protein